MLTRHAPDWIAGHWLLSSLLGAVPRDLVVGNDGAFVTCGGHYPPDAGGYEDNSAVLASPVT